ncbi:MAG TPA: HEAT repeat domain-containing protein [Gemmatimonadaceae bacterium]|nr:HEAT repeat domain-containing protein [Gemmatimonadaceae bacterium]
MKAIALIVVTAAFTAGPVAETPASSAPRYVTATNTQDPADSLYRAAREAFTKGDFARASQMFERVVGQYPNYQYHGDAMYFLAFSNYRLGGTDRMRSAIQVLTRLKSLHPNVAKGDAATLRTRICGELAREGDEACAAEVSASASSLAKAERDAEKAEKAAEKAEGRASRSSRSSSSSSSNCPNADDEDDERVAALNALLQMDADRAMPILTKVLERRDECSAALRRKAVFLVSQKRTPQTADLLLKIARNDPDSEVRQQAVFWLSQVPDERAVDMLEDILRNSKDEELQNKALFALSQHRSSRGSAILRDFATKAGASTELRGQAIFWLGQRNSQENNDFLRNLYTRLDNDELKEKVLFSLSQRRGMGNETWLMNIAVNDKEDVELRKKALFWAGQSGVGIDAIIPLYSRISDQEMKEQVIFVLSQRNNQPAAVDKLMDIAKNDKDSELRKKAIFWLGQSRDPRVQQFLLDMINR